MAKGSQELERQFIATAAEKTGRDVLAWLDLIRASGETKQTGIIKWLKESHGLNHMQATFLAGIHFNDGQPVYDYERLFASLFEGKDALRPAYDALEARVLGTGLPELEFVPTRTYISIEGKKVFACATLTRETIRVGLDLGDMPVDAYVQKAKGLGAMPNLTHMIEIRGPEDVDARLEGHIRQAYARTHGG